MQLKLYGALAAVMAVTLAGTGCATKKHVREAIAPVQNQVNVLQKESQENRQAIGDLDRQVAVADEKATEAGKRADTAAAAAQSANDAAAQARQEAGNAISLAEKAQVGVSTLGEQVQSEFHNLDNYRLINSEQVHFKTNAATLSNEEKAQLDRIVGVIGSQRNYLIEVHGFADKTGTKAYNLELSRRRAEAVVNYLVVDRGVPLRSIRTIGSGSDFPNAINRTSAERRENRRVDVKVYSLELSGAVQASR